MADPFREPPWLRGLPSPFYSESHRTWQRHCRQYITEHFSKHVMEWEDAGKVPEHVYTTFAQDNMLIPCLPAPLPVEWLRRVDIKNVGPLAVADFDYIHTSIFLFEMIRGGLSGPVSSLITGLAYGTPPIVDFASSELKERVIPSLLLGKKRVCIAITEPDAGSDVARLQTTAEKTPDGSHYIVNGQKKWITNGLWSDYASTCVRTGGDGPNGLSLLLIPLKDMPGVSMHRMAVSGRKSSGTTFIEFDEVKVPVGNLIGEEGMGMRYIMTNFNHERLSIAINVTTQARAALAAAFEYCTKREAFGAPLISQPVVRNRLARAGAMLETQWSCVESLIYQFRHMSKAQANARLGGMTALIKANAGMVLNECSQAAQILFGGNGYTQTGQGALVEKIAREVAGARVPGGSEDVMLDLCIRQMYKEYRTTQQTAAKL